MNKCVSSNDNSRGESGELATQFWKVGKHLFLKLKNIKRQGFFHQKY